MAGKNKGPTREERIAEARLNLDKSKVNYLHGIAASYFGTPENYGKLVEGMYDSAITKTPDQRSYEQLFLEELRKETGVINAPRLKEKSSQILLGSLAALSVGEALKYLGVKDTNLNPKYAKKYVDELDEREAQAILGVYTTNLVEDYIAKILPERKKGRTKSIEDMFTVAPKK